MGQRKPQSNKRKKKKRSTERRYSDGEASDYDISDTAAKLAPDAAQHYKDKTYMKSVQHDSDVDFSDDLNKSPSVDNSKSKIDTKKNNDQTAIELEFKSDMIFDLDM